jgi:integrase
MKKTSKSSLSSSTIQSYVSALRWFDRLAGNNSLDDNFNVKIANIIKGYKKLYPKKSKRAPPITTEILLACRQQINDDDPASVTIWAAMTTAFFGLLRSGELANPSIAPLMSNQCQINHDHATIYLEKSKTDQHGQGQTIYLPRDKRNPLCPSTALRKMLRMRDHSQHSPFLFAINGKPLTKRLFVCSVRQLLQTAGTRNAATFSGHSFRRGGATFAHSIDLSDDDIKSLGRWKSFAFTAYIDRSTQQHISSASYLLHSSFIGVRRKTTIGN